ncbi:hypothetical protein CG716_05320 [Mycolicibacterium sphagni]|uniref:Uncharacterized protein n=1 Tax=Mycolicibacterium sphagni TaxID=1786 RepID=A0A255E136_9MYCO|nr:hypothetical protein CG716_05320 [Mycolicibacterium sphagni]
MSIRTEVARVARAHGWTVTAPKPDPIDAKRGASVVIYNRHLGQRILIGWHGSKVHLAVRDHCLPTEQWARGDTRLITVFEWLESNA